MTRMLVSTRGPPDIPTGSCRWSVDSIYKLAVLGLRLDQDPNSAGPQLGRT